ncbi:MAG TPA: vWA domain-containing protein [Enhygromyxa sp.]|nr:vWA domain-containing protein [Enhygromyxa sp.]
MRASVVSSLSLAFACACQAQPKPVELAPDLDPDAQLQLTEQKDVDILFVIDNSGSMGAEQANLAANFGAFIEVLEQQDVEANYRIGVTTSDNGNPWCGTTTPEAGALVLSSCRERIADFVFADQADARDLACNDICALDDAALTILPTATELDPELAPRPWLERIEGHQNLPLSTSMVDAFRCFGPQGINGCGFESPLESMLLALARADTPDEPEHGFMRAGALLAVVFVTDEVDCSYNQDYAGIFTGEQGTVFWSDPEASAPGSDLCWRAGVECFGDPSGYDSCEPVDRGVDAQPVDEPESDAVLHPLSRYFARLDAIEQHKQQINPDAEIIVGLIGGVQPDGSLVYADGSDPEFQAEFGIGPGCTGPLGEAAVPPVRLRELTERYTQDNLHSICATDFTGALTTIADAIRTEIIPACHGRCVADVEPATELVEPHCELEQELPGVGVRPVLECLRDQQGAYVVDPASGSYTPPNEAELCFAMLTDDAGLTPDALDDIAPYCLDRGHNLQFQLAYAAGVVPPTAAITKATCALSQEPELDCPQL